MTISFKHLFSSGKADGADATKIQPSNWNAEHTVTMAADRLLGRATAGTGAVEEITCTAAGRAVLDDANAAAQLATLGVAFASQAEAEAGSDATKYMNPLRVAQAITALVSGARFSTFFTASGTWTRQTGTKKVLVFCIGGGGGGGKHATLAISGSGAGALGISFIDVSATATAAVVVGAGGVGATSAAAGGTGGASGFGGTVAAGGGQGGSGAAVGNGGAGGAASADLNVSGERGCRGLYTYDASVVRYVSGDGGSTIFGAAGQGGYDSTVDSIPPVGYGSGAGGPKINTNGDAGKAGIVWVLEF